MASKKLSELQSSTIGLPNRVLAQLDAEDQQEEQLSLLEKIFAEAALDTRRVYRGWGALCHTEEAKGRRRPKVADLDLGDEEELTSTQMLDYALTRADQD